MKSVRSVVSLVTRRTTEVAVGAILLMSAVAWLYIGRGVTWHGDEWDYLLGRREWTWETTLAPHNGHLTLIDAIYLRIGPEIVGLGHYIVFRLVNTVLFAVTLGAFFFIASRRAGTTWALVGVTLFAFAAGNAANLWWAFQVAFFTGLLAGLLALIALDRETFRGDLAASLFVALALASVSYGIFFCIAISVELLVRRQWRRSWVTFVPLALYGLWRYHYKPAVEPAGVTLVEIVVFMLNAYTGTIASLAHLPTWSGRVIGVGIIVGLVTVGVRERRHLEARHLTVLLLPIMTWGVTGAARHGVAGPLEARYMLPNVLMLLLALAHFLPRWHPTQRQGWLLSVALLAAVAGHVDNARNAAVNFRTLGDEVRAQLAALEYARDVAPAGLVLTPPHAFGAGFRADRYWEATDTYGHPAVFSEARLRTVPTSLSLLADRVSRDAVGFTADPVPKATLEGAGPSPQVRTGRRVRVETKGSCVRLRRTGSRPSVATLVAPPQSVLIRPSRRDRLTVRLSRWSHTFPTAPDFEIGQTTRLRHAQDRAGTVWRAELRFNDPVEVCDATT